MRVVLTRSKVVPKWSVTVARRIIATPRLIPSLRAAVIIASSASLRLASDKSMFFVSMKDSFDSARIFGAVILL